MDPSVLLFCMAMSLAGCALGTFTGLVPGIHVNTLAALMLTAYPVLGSIVPYGEDVTAMAVCCCIMAASVVHSFVDFIPSVFIGAPDAEDAVSIMPGHRLLLEGRGMEAVRAAAIGSLIGCSAAIVLSVPLQWVFLQGMGGYLEVMTPLVLMAAMATVILGEHGMRDIPIRAVIFLISGALGLGCMTLVIPMDGMFGEGNIMMPLLTGLFGIPVMLESASGAKVPVQRDMVKDPVGMLPGLKGVLMGTVAGWFPGITSTVGASMSAIVFREDRPAGFISTVASIGTVTSVLSLMTLSVSGNGRSGTAIVIGEIIGPSIGGFASGPFMVLLLATAVASAVGYIVTISCGRAFTKIVHRMEPDGLGRIVLVLLVILTLVLTGPTGLFILFCSTVIGMLPGMFGTGRTVLCGCLILPVLLFKLGLA